MFDYTVILSSVVAAATATAPLAAAGAELTGI
jgi:hypothetical protein